MKEDIYLTFKTDYKTHYLLKTLAHAIGKTQPEFINDICKNYVDSVMDDIEKKIKEYNEEKEIRHDPTDHSEETDRPYQS